MKIILETGTSKTSAEAALFKSQQAPQLLTGYHSKKWLQTVQNYGITKLE